MAYTLSDARLWVRQFARNAQSSSMYSDSDVDRAIMTVGDDFVWKTNATRTLSSLSIISGTSTITSGFATGFVPERILRAYIATYNDLTITTHETVLRLLKDNAISAGTPTHLGFYSTTALEMYPTPDANYTLKVLWVPPFSSFTVGTGSPTGVTFNLPDEYLRVMWTYGAPAMLQHNEPEHAYASESWKKYEEFRNRLVGAGGLGARSQARNGAQF